MSIPVQLEDLAAATADRPFGRVDRPGRRTRATASARPAVTLVHPPPTLHGYALIVDGTCPPAARPAANP